jgi:hypothetical protein
MPDSIAISSIVAKIRLRCLSMFALYFLTACSSNYKGTTTAPGKPVTLASPTATLTVSPGMIVPDQKATLIWTTTNATTIAIDQIGVVAPNGQQNVSPSATTTYTLTASGPSDTAQSTATLTPLNIIFSDNFERPDQSGLGSTPQGQIWTVTGRGSAAIAISGHHYIDGPPADDNCSYAGIQMNRQPIRLGGKFSFLPSGTGGTGYSALALMSSKDNGLALQNVVHLNVATYALGLTWYQGTSRGIVPASCNGTQTGEHYFAVPLLTDGTSYPIYMTIDGDKVTVDGPDGSTMVCTDPHFSQVAGTFGIWELQYSSNDNSVPRWDKAEAFSEIQ